MANMAGLFYSKRVKDAARESVCVCVSENYTSREKERRERERETDRETDGKTERDKKRERGRVREL